MLLGVAEGNHDLLLKVKAKYRTFLLSNINAIHYDYIMDYLKRDFGFDGNDHLVRKGLLFTSDGQAQAQCRYF